MRPLQLRFAGLVAMLALAVAAVAPAHACGGDVPCRIAGGAYRYALPPGAETGKAVGAFVFFHGHRSSAAEMMAYRDLVEAVHALGFAFVAADGIGESWSTPGSPGEGRRDEAAFVAALLDDLPGRFTLDPARLVASGFSQGASLVWDIACRGDGRFRAFMPIAGVWWRPMPETCTAPARPLLHIHGEADPVMPLAGRSLRDGRWRQGDVREAFATLLRHNRCDRSPSTPSVDGALTCRTWAGCAHGAGQALCLHPGDHHTDPRWLKASAGWLGKALETGRP